MTNPRSSELEQLVSTAVHALPLVLFALDSTGRVTCAIATRPLFFDHRPEGLLLADLFPALKDAIGRAQRGEHVAELVSTKGKLFDVHLCPGAEGLVVGTAVDVTDRERMRRDLVATERLAALGTLAGGVAHELNNPLTYLSLNLSSARRALAGVGEAPEDERASRLRRAERALEIAEEGVSRVTASVRDLSLFARAPSQEREPLDVREAMDAAISITWNEIRHRARLRKVYADVRRVEANPGELRQVFAHLLLNAAGAIPESAAEHHEISISIETSADGRVVVLVSDTGRGIPEDLVARVFEPFFRLDGEDGKRGLGLAMCRGIVQGLSGTITLESPRPGLEGGTQVVLTFPIHDPTSRIPSSSTMRAARGVATARALLVDDEPLVGDAVRRALTPEIEVVLATSGRQAIDLILSDQAFDAIVCDLMMPDIGGMDVYEAIRRARPGLVERFLFMTGGAFTPKAARFLSQMGTPVLEKPIAVEALREAILSRAALRRGR